MDDVIKGFIKTILNMVQGSADFNGISANLSSWSPDLYKFAAAIQTQVMKPVGYTILALFALMELYQVFQRIEINGGGSDAAVKMVSGVMIKVAFCKIAMDSMSLFLEAIMQISIYLTKNIQKLTKTGNISTGLTMDEIFKPMEHEAFWFKIIILFIVFMALLATMVSILMVNVSITMRFLELYVYLAVAPIPLATMPQTEHSNIAKNFFKSFTATAIQGTLIYMVGLFYPFLVKTAFTHGAAGQWYNMLASIFAFSILLVLAVLQTNKWAKSLTTAM